MAELRDVDVNKVSTKASSKSIISWMTLLRLVGWPQSPPLDKLAQYEDKILSSITGDQLERRYVCVNKDQFIWTLSTRHMSSQLSTSTPIVLLHGVGTGVALWLLNLVSLASHRAVYAVDMLGFGRSSRVTFSVDPVIAEMEFVESLESWRKAVGLDCFILVGHCFGGYIATSYALRYPDRVRHLVLVDPWGFQEQPSALMESDDDRKLPSPLWVRTLALALQPFLPFALLRVAGSWGPAIVTRFKPDLIAKFSHLFKDDTIAQYIYHWNAQTPSGETAFKHMSQDFGWARFPMIHRIKDMSTFVSMTFICGSRSLVDSNIGKQIQDLRRESYVDAHVVNGAGHFVFTDKADLFNKLLQHTCSVIDHRLDIVPAQSLRNRLRRVRSESSPNLQRVATFHRRRRCDSQRITEEQELSTGTTSTAAAADDDEQVNLSSSCQLESNDDRPLFVVSFDEQDE